MTYFQFLSISSRSEARTSEYFQFEKNDNKDKKVSCTQCCNIFDIKFDLHVQIFFSNSWSFLSMNLIFMTKYFSVFHGLFCFMSKSFWVILGQSLTKHGRSLTWSAWDLFPHVRFSFGSEREPRPHSRDLTAFWKSY